MQPARILKNSTSTHARHPPTRVHGTAPEPPSTHHTHPAGYSCSSTCTSGPAPAPTGPGPGTGTGTGYCTTIKNYSVSDS